VMYDRRARFKILDFETAKEYNKRKAKEKKRKAIERFISEIETDIWRKEVEAKGVCDGCGEPGNLQWVRDGEFYSCYDCFIHDLDCEASVMVPSHRVDQMRDFVEEWEFGDNRE